MRIIDQGYIFDVEQTPEIHGTCTFTGLCRLTSGTILATFRRGSGKDSADGNCLVARSVDNGQTWEIISDAFDTRLDGQKGEIRDADVTELEDGTLLAFLTWIEKSADGSLYDGETDTLLPSGLLLSRSSDGGKTWGPNETLNTQNLNRPVLTGPVAHIPGKGLLVFFENFEPERPGGPSVHVAYALLSPDGKSFDTIVQVARHGEDAIFYWDQRQAVQPGTDRLVGMFWSYDRRAEKDVDIRMAWGNPDTLRWEEPFSTGIEGQIAAPIPLADGRLLTFYVHRSSPGSMRLVGSEDEGKTWDRDAEIVVYNTVAARAEISGKADFTQYWAEISKWTFGHPAAVVLDDRSVLLAYYAGPNEKCLNVHWARVEL